MADEAFLFYLNFEMFDPSDHHIFLSVQSWSAFQRKLTILSTTIIIQAVHNYKSDNIIPENVP